MRARCIAISLVCVACSGKSAPGSHPEEHVDLAGGTVARVGSAQLPASLVGRVAAAQRLSPEQALQRLVEDELLAERARADGLEQRPDVTRDLEALRARLVVFRIWATARAAGSPSDAEVEELSRRHWLEVDLPEQMKVIHAVVLRPKGGDAASARRARDVAGRIAAAVAGAADADDFEARAKSVPSGGLEVKVERLQPFVADGRIAAVGAQGSYDRTFASAAAALSGPGSTSGVIETEFGWHVVRLVERIPGRRVPFEDRRMAFAEEAYAGRAAGSMAVLIAQLRATAPLETANGVDALMEEAAAVVLGERAPPAGPTEQ